MLSVSLTHAPPTILVSSSHPFLSPVGWCSGRAGIVPMNSLQVNRANAVGQ